MKKRILAKIKNNNVNQDNSNNNMVEQYKFVYEQVKSWIENADNKDNISCALFFGIFTVITFLSEKCIAVPENSVVNKCFEGIYTFCFVASIVSAFIALLYYAYSIFPNLSSNETDSSLKRYPIFFGDIASMSAEEYRNKMQKGMDSLFADELILETHMNSKICLNKMKRYRTGLILALITVVFSMLSFVSHFMMYR